MEKSILMIFICTLLLAMPVSAQQPDLQVRDFVYVQETNRLVATVYNQAPLPASGPIVVHFYDGDEKIGEIVYEENIPRYSIVSVYINYRLDEGQHNFRAVVDPFDSVAERNEGNNERGISVTKERNESSVVVEPEKKEEKTSETQEDLTGFYAVVVIVVIAAGYIILKMKPKGRIHAADAKQERKIQKQEKTLTVREIEKMPAGKKVRLRAEIKYHDKIGDDYTYFLKDETGEIVGFSRHEIKNRSGTVTGTTRHYLGKNIAVAIERVE